MAYQNNGPRPFSNAQITVRGNLTGDPRQVSRTENAMAVFSIAVNSRSVDKNGDVMERPTYYNCRAFGYTAEAIMDNFHKGSAVVATGKLYPGDYTNKEGETIKQDDLQIDTIAAAIFKDGGNDDNGSKKPRRRSRRQDDYEDDYDDDDFDDIDDLEDEKPVRNRRSRGLNRRGNRSRRDDDIDDGGIGDYAEKM